MHINHKADFFWLLRQGAMRGDRIYNAKNLDG